MSLARLPSEVLEAISQHLLSQPRNVFAIPDENASIRQSPLPEAPPYHQDTLCSFRLTCRRFSRLESPLQELFHTFLWLPDDGRSLSRIESIVGSSKTRPMVRRVVFFEQADTTRNPARAQNTAHIHGQTCGRAVPLGELPRAVKCLQRLKNLQSFLFLPLIDTDISEYIFKSLKFNIIAMASEWDTDSDVEIEEPSIRSYRSSACQFWTTWKALSESEKPPRELHITFPRYTGYQWPEPWETVDLRSIRKLRLDWELTEPSARYLEPYSNVVRQLPSLSYLRDLTVSRVIPRLLTHSFEDEGTSLPHLQTLNVIASRVVESDLASLLSTFSDTQHLVMMDVLIVYQPYTETSSPGMCWFRIFESLRGRQNLTSQFEHLKAGAVRLDIDTRPYVDAIRERGSSVAQQLEAYVAHRGQWTKELDHEFKISMAT